MTTNLRGILAPALTAVTDNFQIHKERTIAHFEWLLRAGCDGLLLFGTTSEAFKAIIARMRGEQAWKNMQPPLLPFPESELQGLFEKLIAAGFDWPVFGQVSTV